MKRLVKIQALILALIMLICVLPTGAFAHSIKDDDAIFSPSMLSEEYLNQFDVFIFTSYEDFESTPNFLCDMEYTPGYLYVKDYADGSTKLLVNKPVSDYGFCDKYVFYIADGSEIGYIDLSDFHVAISLSIPKANLRRLIVTEEYLYYANGDDVYKMKTFGSEPKCIAKLENMIAFYPLGESKIAWFDNEAGNFVMDLTTGDITKYETFEAMFGHSFDVIDEESIEDAAQPTATATYIALPLTAYPIDSHFTDNGAACNDHPCSITGSCNCKSYRGGIQCWAFARYVFDKYSHCTNYSIWNDSCSTQTHFKVDAYAPNPLTATDTKLRSYKTGTYLRVGSDSSQPSTHSVFVMANDGANITIYECNEDGHCEVGKRQFDYEQFRHTYFIYDVYSHNWGRNVYYNSVYHKVNCTISGCPGYYLEKHNSTCGCNGAINSQPGETE